MYKWLSLVRPSPQVTNSKAENVYLPAIGSGRLILILRWVMFSEETVHRDFIKNRLKKQKSVCCIFVLTRPLIVALVGTDFPATLRILSKLMYKWMEIFLCTFSNLVFRACSPPQIRTVPWDLGLWPMYFNLCSYCTTHVTGCNTAVYIYMKHNVHLSFHSVCEHMVACQGNIIRMFVSIFCHANLIITLNNYISFSC